MKLKCEEKCEQVVELQKELESVQQQEQVSTYVCADAEYIRRSAAMENRVMCM